jgi:hypothetical protein
MQHSLYYLSILSQYKINLKRRHYHQNTLIPSIFQQSLYSIFFINGVNKITFLYIVFSFYFYWSIVFSFFNRYISRIQHGSRPIYYQDWRGLSSASHHERLSRLCLKLCELPPSNPQSWRTTLGSEDLLRFILRNKNETRRSIIKKCLKTVKETSLKWS